MNWTEVRRSVPAENLDGIPDDAEVFACWVDSDDYDKSITIYKAHEESYWLVKEIRERFFIELMAVSYQRALERAKELRDDFEF